MKIQELIKIIFLYAVFSTLISPSFAMHSSIKGSTSQVENDYDYKSSTYKYRYRPKDPQDVFKELPEDVCNLIFGLYDRLKGKDLIHKLIGIPSLAAKASIYFRRNHDSLLGQLNTLTSSMLHHQIRQVLSSTVENEEILKKSFINRLEKKMAQESFLFVPIGSPLATYLHKQFAILDEDDLLQNLDVASSLYQSLFTCILPLDDNLSKKTALKHLQAAWPIQGVYFSKDNKQEGLQNFFNGQKDRFIKELTYSREQKPYIGFLNPHTYLTQLQHQPHNIVVTDTQLEDQYTKSSLQELLVNNSHHTVILSIGDSHFALDGVLNLVSDDLPPALKHLCLMNSKGNVTEIGDDFLSKYDSLTSFNSSGLNNVLTIGDSFLQHCTGLTSFDSSALKNVTSIGDCFLDDCISLASFDSSWLSNVRTLGRDFLYSCTGLTSFDSSWLGNVTVIRSGFLWHCAGLTSLDLSGLNNVTTIEHAFLSNCIGLTSFDSSVLSNVSVIGNNFLLGCTGLTSFDSSGLKNVKTIGNNFLLGCTGLSMSSK